MVNIIKRFKLNLSLNSFKFKGNYKNNDLVYSNIPHNALCFSKCIEEGDLY